jgi:hypothetical protein
MTGRTRHAGAPTAQSDGAVGLGRRDVLEGFACWGLALLGAPLGVVAACEAAAPPTALAAVFGDIVPMRFLGFLYLREHPGESDRRWLSDALFGGSLPQTPAAIAASIAERRRRDLAADDVTIVGGWVMTRSEARLCALAALAAPPA